MVAERVRVPREGSVSEGASPARSVRAEDAPLTSPTRPTPAPCQAGVDVVVASPGRAVALLAKGALELGATRAIVLDEVDVLAGACGECLRGQVGSVLAAPARPAP